MTASQLKMPSWGYPLLFTLTMAGLGAALTFTASQGPMIALLAAFHVAAPALAYAVLANIGLMVVLSVLLVSFVAFFYTKGSERRDSSDNSELEEYDVLRSQPIFNKVAIKALFEAAGKVSENNTSQETKFTNQPTKHSIDGRNMLICLAPGRNLGFCIWLPGINDQQSKHKIVQKREQVLGEHFPHLPDTISSGWYALKNNAGTSFLIYYGNDETPAAPQIKQYEGGDYYHQDTKAGGCWISLPLKIDQNEITPILREDNSGNPGKLITRSLRRRPPPGPPPGFVKQQTFEALPRPTSSPPRPPVPPPIPEQ